MPTTKLTIETLNALRDQVIDCAATWAEFQDPDSLSDQETDTRLRIAATEAAEALRDASDRYSMAMAAFEQQDDVPGAIQE